MGSSECDAGQRESYSLRPGSRKGQEHRANRCIEDEEGDHRLRPRLLPRSDESRKMQSRGDGGGDELPEHS